MTQFRKKPVVIEAKQATGTPESNREIIDWTRGSATPASMDDHPERGKCLSISTLEGAHWVSPGDWIIKGVAGEFYPCKPDIFAATYEAATTALPIIDPGPDSLEREIQAKASVAPRVTPADIEAEIAAEYSTTLDKAFAGCPLVEGMDRVTVAVVVLKNGAKLVGVNYGAIDPANHSSEIGTEQARAAAIEQAWPLLGFRLRDKLVG